MSCPNLMYVGSLFAFIYMRRGKPHTKALKQIPIQAQDQKEQRSGGFPRLYATFPLREVLLMCY